MALRMGGYVDRLLSLSQDAVFQTRLKKQLKRIRKQAYASQALIREQFELTDVDSLSSPSTTSELLQFAVTRICQSTLKPKVSVVGPVAIIVILLERSRKGQKRLHRLWEPSSLWRTSKGLAILLLKSRMDLTKTSWIWTNTRE